MHFAPLSILAGLVALVAAQSSDNAFKIPPGFSITAGKETTIQWNPTTQGPVRLTLRSGAQSNLNQGTVIAPSIPNTGSYTFTVPADTTRNSDYTLAIAPVSDPNNQNYTPQFVVESSNTVQSITPSSGSTASATKTEASATKTEASATKTESATAKATTTGTATTTTNTASARSTSTRSGSSSSSSSSASSSSSSTASAESTSSAAPAPSNNAAVNNVLNIQGALAAMLVGAAAVL